MNHYEIIYIFNPDEKELGKSLFDKILETTKSIKGQIHRSEEIGSRRLAYPIKDFYRGEYFLINLECNSSELASITDLFKFNENILRTSVLKKKQAETGKSALMEQTKDFSYEKDSKDEGIVKKVSNEAKEVLQKHRVEKLLVINDSGDLTGLITVKDILKKQNLFVTSGDATDSFDGVCKKTALQKKLSRQYNPMD